MTSVSSTTTSSLHFPTKMKALRQHAYGEANKVLTFENDVEVPNATGESVLVRVHAVSINPVDYKLLHGDLSMLKKLKFPHTPGNDFAGTVVAVGSACKRLQVRDTVYGTSQDTHGAFAEYILLEEKLVARIPTKLSFEQAAALPMVAQTSLTALNKAGSLTNKRVLVLGGSGGVGSLGIQIAKALGAAYVATTCSSPNTDFVRSLGADHVIDYTAVNFADALSVEPPFDVIYDCIGGREQWENGQRILNKNGSFITVVGDENHDPINLTTAATSVGKVLTRKVASVFTSHNYIFHVLPASYEHLNRISDMVTSGKIRVDNLIDKTFEFNLEEFIALYERSESGHTRGKAVMKILDQSNPINM